MALLLVKHCSFGLEEALSLTWDDAEEWLESAVELARQEAAG